MSATATLAVHGDRPAPPNQWGLLHLVWGGGIENLHPMLLGLGDRDMGRSTHDFLAGALGFYPLAKVRDVGTATTEYGAKWQYPLQSGETTARPAHDSNYGKYLQPYHQAGFDMDSIPSPDMTFMRFAGSPNLMGYTWSAELITEVTDTKIRMESKNNGAGQTSTDEADTDVAAGTNPTGIVKGSFVAADTVEAGPMLNARTGDGAADPQPSNPAPGFALQGITGTSDAINGLCGNSFGCPSGIYDTPNDVFAVGGNKNVGTHTTGVVIGAMTTFVMHDTSLASGQSSTTVRTFRAPFGMRVLKVTFGCAGAGAGNTVALSNNTKGISIVSSTALVAAGSINIEPDGATFLRANANRNIDFDDILNLVAVTSGTGFTNLWCMVTCVVTGNAYGGLDNARTWAYYGGDVASDITQAVGEAVTAGPTKHYSGPVIGNPIALYIGGEDSSASATNEALQTLIVPFDMEVFHVAVFSHSCDANGTTKVRNTTNSTDIIGHIAAAEDTTPSDNTNGNGTFNIANPILKRGDVIGVRTTTTGVATTFAGAVLCGIARGFPYPDATLD